MSETVISVENLYKEYKLGVISHGTLYHDMQSWWARIRGKEDPNSLISVHHSDQAEDKSFIALKDVSFKVKSGDRIGIIGKNGAGKSTILKIISKITTPTKGSIRIKGRVGALLEVGTGFHPELTGRENIFLNGAILGMNRREVTKKLDEIVDFASIEKHLDTPVKRYSSGMNVRLGFAVAAHLEPEILVVDEVLAVGDISFQKKCIGKMKDISEGEGRTILFVSHNMGSISSLCNRTILLQNGQIFKEGGTSEVVAFYFNNGSGGFSFVDYTKLKHTYMDEYTELLRAIICNSDGIILDRVSIDESFFVKMTYKVKKKINGKCVPNFHFFSCEGSYIFVSSPPNVNILESGIYTAICEVPMHLINNGIINIGVALTTYIANGHFVNFFDKSALTLNIIDLLNDGSRRYGYSGKIPGYVRPNLDWEIIKED